LKDSDSRHPLSDVIRDLFRGAAAPVIVWGLGVGQRMVDLPPDQLRLKRNNKENDQLKIEVN